MDINIKKQLGFSLLEALVAMLLAAVGIAMVMVIHSKNLFQVNDYIELNRAQLILNNMAYRLQLMSDQGLNTTSSQSQILSIITEQAVEAGLKSPVLSITDGFWLQIDWFAHDQNDPVIRSACINVGFGRHCLGMLVMP